MNQQPTSRPLSRQNSHRHRSSRGIGSRNRTKTRATRRQRDHRLPKQQRTRATDRATYRTRRRSARTHHRMQGRRDRPRPSQRTHANHGQHFRQHRHPHQQRTQSLLVRPAQPQYLRQHRLERLCNPARRMPQRHLQHLHSHTAIHATPIMGTYRQHLQQPRRQPHVPYHDYIAAKAHSSGSHARWRRKPARGASSVNAIAAGLTVGTDSSRATTEDIREHIIEQTPLGRLATADDIAGGVAMLVGEDARFITGQTLHVDGGLTMR